MFFFFSSEVKNEKKKNRTSFSSSSFNPIWAALQMSLPSRLASLAGWVPVAIVFGQHVAAPAGVKDGSMAPTLRGPGGGAGGSREDDGEDDDGDRRRRSLLTSPSTSTRPPPPPPRHREGGDRGDSQQPSLLSVALSGGDIVLVDKLAARTQRYRRGDVVLIR